MCALRGWMPKESQATSVARAIRYLSRRNTNGYTTIIDVAKRTKLSCEQVHDTIRDDLYWFGFSPDADKPFTQWLVFEDGD